MATEPGSRAGTENLEGGTEKQWFAHLLFPRTQVYKEREEGRSLLWRKRSIWGRWGKCQPVINIWDKNTCSGSQKSVFLHSLGHSFYFFFG